MPPGDVQALPFPASSFDEVLLLHVLVHVEEPARAVAEASRVLRPGGRLVITTVAPHEHPEITASYGHLHAGLPPRELEAWLQAAGLVVEECAITSREKRAPQFEVITVLATQESPVAAGATRKGTAP